MRLSRLLPLGLLIMTVFLPVFPEGPGQSAHTRQNNSVATEVQLGHSDAITAACFSPDGRTILSGSRDGTMILWDVISGKEMRRFTGHTGSVRSVCFSPDGRLAVSGSSDDTIRLWDAASGRKRNVLRGHVDGVISVTLTPDGKRLASGGGDDLIMIWDAESGALIKKITGHENDVSCVRFSPDGRVLLSADLDGKLLLYEADSFRKRAEFSVSDIPVCAFSPDGKRMIAGGEDRMWRLFDTKTAKEIRVYKGHAKSVTSLAFSPDGRRVLSGAWDGTVKLWDLARGNEIFSLKGHTTKNISAVDISPDGKYALSSGASDRTIKLWDLAVGKEIRAFTSHSTYVIPVCFAPDGRRVLSGAWDGAVRQWDLDRGRETGLWKVHAYGVQSINLIGGRANIITCSNDRSLKITDGNTGKVIRTLTGHDSDVYGAVVSPDGTQVLSSDHRGTVKCWNISDGALVWSSRVHAWPTMALAVPPNGQYVYSASLFAENVNGKETNIDVNEIKTGRLIKTLPGHSPGIHCLCFSSNGVSLLAGSADGVVRLLDPVSGGIIRTFHGHAGAVNSVCFSPDDKQILSGSFDGTIKLWETAGGRLVTTLSGHQADVVSACFSPDGKRVLSSSLDGTVRLWDPASGGWTALVSGVHGTPDQGKWLIFTHDGYWDGSADGGDLVAAVRGLEVWNIDQFAARNNRPDIILERIGSSQAALIAHYRNLYRKRLRRLGLTEHDPGREYHAPRAEIQALAVNGQFATLRFSLEDSQEHLKSYNLYVNDVPLFGARGKQAPGGRAVITERIELTGGTNKIEVSCLNARGAECFRPVVYADFNPKTNVVPDLYFLGFGVSRYKNKLNGESVDLRYAAKDAGDLAAVFTAMKKKGYGNVYAKTYVDGAVTVGAIRSAKRFLAKARPDDTLVLFISGHGKYVDGTYYYVTHETDFKNIPDTAADFELVEDLLQGISPRRKLFLMDTCESGEREGTIHTRPTRRIRGLVPRALPSGRGISLLSPTPNALLERRDRYIYNDLFRRSGAITFSSSRGNEFSLEAEEFQNGLFTAFIKRGLSGPADEDGDGRVAVRELVRYVSETVPAEAETLARRHKVNLTQHPTVDRDNIYIHFTFPVVQP